MFILGFSRLVDKTIAFLLGRYLTCLESRRVFQAYRQKIPVLHAERRANGDCRSRGELEILPVPVCRRSIPGRLLLVGKDRHRCVPRQIVHRGPTGGLFQENNPGDNEYYLGDAPLIF